MSQVLRRALASFDPSLDPKLAISTLLRSSYLSAFTFGGAKFIGHLSVHPEGQEELELSESSTVEARVTERVPA